MKDSTTIILDEVEVTAYFDIDDNECTIERVMLAGVDVTKLIEAIRIEWFKEQEDVISANYVNEPDYDHIYESRFDK